MKLVLIQKLYKRQNDHQINLKNLILMLLEYIKVMNIFRKRMHGNMLFI